MTLVTRCPACDTVFRVVRDQLKVSDGWVRCGRCSEVFNGAERLFELEAGQPTDAMRPAAPPTPASVAPALPEPVVESLQPGPAATTAATATVADASPSSATAVEAVLVPVGAATGNTSDPTPGFVRRAERAERWRSPQRRIMMAGATLLLALLLVGQIAMHYRDLIAARWPETRLWLEAGCAPLDCRVEAPRHIEALNVDSSGLVRLPDSALYRLTVVLQNKAPTIVRMPALDLTLTDLLGRTMARRVLTASELGEPADHLAAQGELALQATLDLGGRDVAGYTIELFYP